LGTVRLRHAGPVQSVVFTHDGKTLISGGWDRTIRTWDVATGKEILRITGHEYGVTSVALSPDGRLIASRSEDSPICLWDFATGKQVGPPLMNERTVRTILSVAFSPDGRLLASGSGLGEVRIWDVATRKQVRQFSSSNNKIGGVVFSPDGKRVLAAI